MHASGYFSKVKVLFANLQNVDFLDEKVDEFIYPIKHAAESTYWWWVKHQIIKHDFFQTSNML